MAITTAEELFSRSSELGRCELLRGELEMMIPTGGEHGGIVVNLTGPIHTHVRKNDLGRAYGAETGFVLSRDPDTVRAPDVAFIRKERLEQVHTKKFIPGPPDLAVEVLSPDDRPGYVREKVAEWLESGTRAVWVVDPDTRTVAIHEPDRKPVTLDETQTIDGGAVLPGFTLAVSEVFV